MRIHPKRLAERDDLLGLHEPNRHFSRAKALKVKRELRRLTLTNPTAY